MHQQPSAPPRGGRANAEQRSETQPSGSGGLGCRNPPATQRSSAEGRPDRLEGACDDSSVCAPSSSRATVHLRDRTAQHDPKLVSALFARVRPACCGFSLVELDAHALLVVLTVLERRTVVR